MGGLGEIGEHKKKGKWNIKSLENIKASFLAAGLITSTKKRVYLFMSRTAKKVLL